MKTMKKLFCLALTIILALALAAPAFAATITVSNSVKDETYNVYKIFDVTKAMSEDEAVGYAYTINSSNAWYETVSAYASEEGNGLTLTPTPTAGVYNVSVNTETFDAAKFAATLSAAKDGKPITASGTGTGSALNIDVVDAGYYFVDTSLGSLCSLLTSDETVEIVEKNSIPSLQKYVKEDSTSAWGEDATADYGQSVEFKLTVNTGTNGAAAADNNTGVDADYVITDKIPANMTLDNKGTGEAPIYVTMPEGWAKDTDYTESLAGDTLTITLKAAKLATLGENANIDITYSATLTKNATVKVAETNTATLTYKNQSSTDSADVFTYNIGGTAEGATFTKVDGATEQPLAGVKFVLMKGEQYAVLSGDKLDRWTSNVEEATPLITNEKGNIYAYGLDADTYVLKETETLPGYNLLADTITATIAENGDVTYKYTSSEGGTNNSITVENNTGTELPGTGGMGTTIFYTLGGVLVVGAAVLLVTKKRMSNAQ